MSSVQWFPKESDDRHSQDSTACKLIWNLSKARRKTLFEPLILLFSMICYSSNMTWRSFNHRYAFSSTFLSSWRTLSNCFKNLSLQHLLTSTSSVLSIWSTILSVTYSKGWSLRLIRKYWTRLKRYSLPPIEAILEVLLTKTKAEEKMKDESLVLAIDAVNYLSGNTISFLEFT